jgi:hypothetical protein
MRSRGVQAWLLSVVFLLASCTGPGPAAEVDDHQQRWDAHAFDLYKMTLTFNTPTRGEQTLDVLVRDGESVDRAYLNMKKARVRDDGTVDGIPATVSDLFDVVRDSSDADTLTVMWDDEFGYPASIVVDVSDAWDDESRIDVSEVIPLEATA